MAVYAIGDIQGCYDPFRKLLDELDFDPERDTLWLAGDLVNRGPKSLKTLRFVKSLGDSAITVLGNHDLHLLALWVGSQRFGKRFGTLGKLLGAPDADELCDWLRHQPLAHYDQLDLGDRCIWYRGVPSFPTAYNNNYQIFQTPDVVAIVQEHIHDVRFIHLDGRPNIPDSVRQYSGDARGHWEGDTLVVETTHFNEHAFIRNFAPTLSQALHVVERFTRVDEHTVGYEFTVTDPNTWSQPWGGSLPMTPSTGPMFEYACHEGNYGMTNMLAGSRMEEAGK
jgi:hypothetical protein